MKPWTPPERKDRAEGFECLIWHEGKWRHVKWSTNFDSWSFGYAAPFTLDCPNRLYAPLPDWTPQDRDFYQDGRPS